MDPSLKDIIAGYGGDKGLDVSAIIGIERETEGDPIQTHIKTMKPMLMQMTEGEMMGFISKLIEEYNSLSKMEGNDMMKEGSTQTQGTPDANYPADMIEQGMIV